MMNIQNLGLKESVGLNVKTTYPPNSLKGPVIVVILLSQVGFESDCPGTKVLNNHFVMSVQKQPSADVLQKMIVAKTLQQENICVRVSC